MNKHELRGGARYVGGKVEKAVGDMVDSRDWKVAGVTDQVAGGAEHLFGRVQSIAGDVADATPSLIEHARDKAGDAAGRTVDAARRGSDRARASIRGNEATAYAIAAALGGYALGWLIHRRRG